MIIFKFIALKPSKIVDKYRKLRAHNPKVTDSSPVPATKDDPPVKMVVFLFSVHSESPAISRISSKIGFVFWLDIVCFFYPMTNPLKTSIPEFFFSFNIANSSELTTQFQFTKQLQLLKILCILRRPFKK